MSPTARCEALLRAEPLGSDFVSNQALTCDLKVHEDENCAWSYLETSTHFVCAGMPRGTDRAEALARFRRWCQSWGKRPLLFGCEPQDVALLEEHWDLVELGRQPLFLTSDLFHPEQRGPDQPASHREMRRMARRAVKKDVEVEEISQGELWEMTTAGLLDGLLAARWKRQPIAEFGFLVKLHLEKGGQVRRYFVARYRGSNRLLALAILVESGRGYLLEHQMLAGEAPNGTGELLLCQLLASFLPEGKLLSLGITPLYRSLTDSAAQTGFPSILSEVPAGARDWLLRTWEPLYGFRSLLNFRTKLEPERWEPVYWAHDGQSQFAVLLAVLQAFADGSLWRFAGRTLSKTWLRFCRRFSRPTLARINTFFIVSLIVWIPILWHLDGTQLFGLAESTRVWACYDVCILTAFLFHGRSLRAVDYGISGSVLLGLVTADTVLSWLMTAFVHQGLPAVFPWGLFLVMINSAPLAAVCFLLICRGARFPLTRRELADT